MGLLGSGHCLAMCGGIASSLQLASKGLSQTRATLAYNLGRLASYVLAGALVGGLSGAFAKQNQVFSNTLSVLSAVFMILVGLYVMRLAGTLNWLEKIGKWALWQHLVKLNRHLLPVDSFPKAFAYGALWGWLPCGLVYSALTWALTSQSALNGALFMMLFAVGTLPAMISLGLGAARLKHILNHTFTRLFLGNLLLWYGFYRLIVATRTLVA